LGPCQLLSLFRLFEKLCQSRALKNTCLLLWVDQVENCDGVGFGGGSLAVSPLGEMIAERSKMKKGPKVVEVDLDEVERARYSIPLLIDVKREDAEQLLKAYPNQES